MPARALTSPPAVTVTLNGEALQVRAGTTLADVLAQRGIDPKSVATAVNAEFVPRTARAATVLRANDSITTFQAIVGG